MLLIEEEELNEIVLRVCSLYRSRLRPSQKGVSDSQNLGKERVFQYIHELRTTVSDTYHSLIAVNSLV